MLLTVRFPARYPAAGAPPELELRDVMVVSAEARCESADALRTLASIAEPERITAAMLEEATRSLPDPCVYETTLWLVENVFDFLVDV